MPKRDDFIADVLTSRTDDCIAWPFAVRKSSGYGAHSTRKAGKKRNYDAHRFVCSEAHGSPPPGMQAAHSCGNKLCVNPKHLYWATAKENLQDAKRHGTLRGGGRYRQRFFEAEIQHIVSSPQSIIELAKQYNTDPAYIGRLRRVNFPL
jgi:hypothetical protein